MTERDRSGKFMMMAYALTSFYDVVFRKDNIAANPGREAYGGREECSASVGAFGIP